MSRTRKEAQLVVIIIPRNMSAAYGKLKQILTKDRPIPSQVIMSNTVNKPLNVVSKIAL